MSNLRSSPDRQMPDEMTVKSSVAIDEKWTLPNGVRHCTHRYPSRSSTSSSFAPER